MRFITRYADRNDLFQIAEIHMQCFAGYFSSKLGPKLLKQYYEAYYNSFPHLFAVVFDADANRLIGFANGYVIGQNVRNHFIKAHFPRTFKRCDPASAGRRRRLEESAVKVK